MLRKKAKARKQLSKFPKEWPLPVSSKGLEHWPPLSCHLPEPFMNL
jgi:hypothetical protein